MMQILLTNKKTANRNCRKAKTILKMAKMSVARPN